MSNLLNEVVGVFQNIREQNINEFSADKQFIE